MNLIKCLNCKKMINRNTTTKIESHEGNFVFEPIRRVIRRGPINSGLASSASPLFRGLTITLAG
jgi:hypothetical protein